MSYKAICKSRNGESWNGMRGMMEMRGISVGIRGINVENAGNQGGNVRMRGMWRMGWECGESGWECEDYGWQYGDFGWESGV